MCSRPYGLDAVFLLVAIDDIVDWIGCFPIGNLHISLIGLVGISVFVDWLVGCLGSLLLDCSVAARTKQKVLIIQEML